MATCPSCGGPVPSDQSRCPACGADVRSPAPTDVPRPPDLGLPATAPVTAGSYASLGDRMRAVFLDTLVLVAALWASVMWVANRYGGLTPEGFNLVGGPALIAGGLSALVFLAYCLCLEWWFGATLGKVVAGAKVTGAAGGAIDFRRSLIRNLFRLIDGIALYLVGAVAVLITRRQQRLGDMLAGTVVTRNDHARYARLIALLVLVALPVAAVAGTWSLRFAPIGGLTTGGATTGSDARSTQGGTGGDATGPRTTPALKDVSDGALLLTGFRFAAGQEGPERPAAVFKAGETPTLLFKIKGLASDDTQKARVRMTVIGHDPDGVPINDASGKEVQPPATAGALESWANVSLPDYVIPGEYRLDLTVVDLVGNRKVVASAPFRVEGAAFEPSATLVLRNVRLTEGEDGPPRADARYSAGSTVWMAFDIVGFRAGADKTIRVQEHMTVVSASGEKVLDGQVLDLNRQFFYVPKRLPITNNISLGQIPPGEYQATLTVTDGVGSQRYEHAVRFTIQR